MANASFWLLIIDNLGGLAGMTAGAGFVILLVVSIALDWWIARVAKARGDVFSTYFVVGLLLSPIASWIMLLTSTRRPAKPGAWMPDPGRPGYLRWWDGTQWTDNYEPMVPR